MTSEEGGDGPSFGLSEDQAFLRETVRRFAEERIQPGTFERDASHEFPAEIIQELGELGLCGMMIDEEYGGTGIDAVSYCIAIEELARVCPSVAVTLSVTNSVACWPIWQFGSEELKRGPLTEMASGACLGAFALTEPGSGSDVSTMRTTAVRDGDEWVLNGEKAWITNAGRARYYVAFAKTDPEVGKRGISAFVVPADSAGCSTGEPERKLGLKSSNTAAVLFENCRIPTSALLGTEGKGLNLALATLGHSRLGIAAQALGIHQRAVELAVEYARERIQFGVPIAQHQAIQFKIATMATELAAARLLTHRAAADCHSKEAVKYASEAKLYSSEAANRAVFESLQIHGGNGFSEEYEISRLYRDARVTTIYEGTSEIQRMVIARSLLS